MTIRKVKWKTASGKWRRIRLHKVYRNMVGRTRGSCSQKSNGQRWLGIPIEFRDWHHFREWALRSGYRAGVQLDRKEPDGPYSEGNCQWLTATEHTAKSLAAHKPGCQCGPCRYGRSDTQQPTEGDIYDY